MISCKFMGRYGNVLFQIAMVHALAKKHNTDYILHTDKYDAQLPNLKFLPMDEWKEITKEWPLYIDPRPHRFTWPAIKPNLMLEGWFQSYKFIEGLEGELLDLFDIQIAPINRVAIHVRRGDYLEYQDSFPVLNGSYYVRAIKAFKDSGINRFTIFSDDIPWCKQFFKDSEADFVFSEGDVFTDFAAMINHSHAIIANSSLSQLAAILNPNKDKIIISPHHTQWYGVKNSCYTFDMCPMDWVKIKT